MCGRYNIITDAQALVDAFGIEHVLLDMGAFRPRYNVAPSQDVPVVRQTNGGRELLNMRWGLVPAWSPEPKTRYSTINARAETVAEKPLFRDAFRRRRCLVPATGFYEWRAGPGGKTPYHIRMRDAGLFAFAGVWEHWEKDAARLDSCSIIVTTANAVLRPIHDRMPVILDPADWDDWLAPDTASGDRLRSLLVPHDPAVMQAYPVDTLVNNPRNDLPRCITPAQDPPPA